MIQNPERHARILRHTPPPPHPPSPEIQLAVKGRGRDSTPFVQRGGGHVHVVAGGWRSGEVSKEVVVEKEACREIGEGGGG